MHRPLICSDGEASPWKDEETTQDANSSPGSLKASKNFSMKAVRASSASRAKGTAMESRTRFIGVIAALVVIMAVVAVGSVIHVASGPPETKTLIVKTAKGLTLAQAQAVVNKHGGTPKG